MNRSMSALWRCRSEEAYFGDGARLGYWGSELVDHGMLLVVDVMAGRRLVGYFEYNLDERRCR